MFVRNKSVLLVIEAVHVAVNGAPYTISLYDPTLWSNPLNRHAFCRYFRVLFCWLTEINILRYFYSILYGIYFDFLCCTTCVRVRVYKKCFMLLLFKGCLSIWGGMFEFHVPWWYIHILHKLSLTFRWIEKDSRAKLVKQFVRRLIFERHMFLER